MNLPSAAAPKPAQPSVDLATDDESSTPRMPHERDEGVGMTDGKPSEIVKRGHDDVERGVQDTSRAPEADRAYDKLKKR